MSNEQPSWTFADGSEIHIGTMYCIGRNYAAHAREMGATVPEDPIVFLKPPAAYRRDGSVIELPSWSADVHHEVELVVVIGSRAENIAVSDAWSVVAGVGVGLDLTARDVQASAKKNGHPWAVAKSWKGSAPVSKIVPVVASGRGPWELSCEVNGTVRQHSTTAHMERSVEQMISYLSSVFTLERGDCIFTGTPEGVGPIRSGDVVHASLSPLVNLSVSIA
ncbi:MAG: fumarylacetoacetate hydrolase family protein [Ignavibacteria bacterium]|nr:fumarylacetoacetate hydrolase family protein [Ignavibacteria bacterium]MBK6419666.1 fumarylacetoacetate hydrolase family protein [Ignavibacteria bacterium]MBK7033109.1 fumarylacetoacetate hydrolase family protein [Ignavibacteria bacterium]MBP7094152.1 fumarylacetoacetate hydrolase family protein [Candidatus Kapabacteria bacterium]